MGINFSYIPKKMFVSFRCAILGEINSGKSLLISCLVGGSMIDEGHIWVLGGEPGTKSSKTLTKYVGYMPQVSINCCTSQKSMLSIKF